MVGTQELQLGHRPTLPRGRTRGHPGFHQPKQAPANSAPDDEAAKITPTPVPTHPSGHPFHDQHHLSLLTHGFTPGLPQFAPAERMISGQPQPRGG